MSAPGFTGSGIERGRSCCEVRGLDLGLACQLFGTNREAEVERFPVTSTPSHPNYSNKN